MKEKVYEVYNSQVQAELYSAYLYLAMSFDMESKNYKGMANWLEKQYNEEREHAFKLIKFMQECGEKPVLQQIDMPAADFGTPAELFAKVLEHEKHVTALIHNMYAVAIEEKDYAAQIHLQWFVSEQVEEEANASEILDKLQMVGDSVHGIMMIDAQLGGRK